MAVRAIRYIVTGSPPSSPYSLALLFRVAASSFLMSSGESCGRSTLIVSLLSLPVNVNGGL